MIIAMQRILFITIFRGAIRLPNGKRELEKPHKVFSTLAQSTPIALSPTFTMRSLCRLRKAHSANDRAVMQAYGFDVKTMTESSCVAELMKMYQKLVSKESTNGI